MTPKPLIHVKDRPLIWHIMKNYSLYGFNDFLILGGYKSQEIKKYFQDYWLIKSDFEIDLATNTYKISNNIEEKWTVTILDTGVDTETGSRLLQAKNFINETFMLTYGDGISDVNILTLLNSHKLGHSPVTLTAVMPPARFGAVNLENGIITKFEEKPRGEGSLVNGGFFVCEASIFDLLWELNCSFERDVLPQIASRSGINPYIHTGFWQPVDTVRDLNRLEEWFNTSQAPWL